MRGDEWPKLIDVQLQQRYRIRIEEVLRRFLVGRLLLRSTYKHALDRIQAHRHDLLKFNRGECSYAIRNA